MHSFIRLYIKHSSIRLYIKQSIHLSNLARPPGVWKRVFWWRSSSYRCRMRDVAPMAHFVRRLIALTVELERECPCQLSQRPFKDLSEACSHKNTATKGRSCWLPTAAAKSCFACVAPRSHLAVPCWLSWRVSWLVS